jgi:hypothetical protein
MGNFEAVRNLWIVGSSPTMTMKRKQLQALLEAVFPGLSFPRKRESIFSAVKHHFRTTSIKWWVSVVL